MSGTRFAALTLSALVTFAAEAQIAAPPPAAPTPARAAAPATATPAAATPGVAAPAPAVDLCGPALSQQRLDELFSQTAEVDAKSDDEVARAAAVDIAQSPPVAPPSKQAAAPAESGVTASP